MADFSLSAEIDLRTRNLSQVIRQIQGGVKSINGNINVGVSQGTQRGISRVNKTLNVTNKNLKRTQKDARAAADSIEYFGKQSALAIRRFAAFTIVTTGFINFSKSVRASIEEAIDFQQELIRISQVTGRTTKGLGGLVDEITRLSTTLGVSSSELLTASRTLSQTGLSARDVEKSLQAIARTDLSPTFDNIVDTTEGSIAIFRQFSVDADTLEKKLSSINSVSKKFAIESSDVITAVRRAGGAFNASGGNLEEFIALLTSVRSTTRESAESIATGFRTIFTRLQRTRTQKFLEDLGINLRNAEQQFVGPFEAIRRLSQALANIPSTDPRFAQIIEELGGFRQVTKVIPLIQQFKVSEEALAVAQKENNSLALDAEIAQEALATQIQKTREAFEELIRTVAQSDSFDIMAKAVLGLANAAVKLADALVPLLPAITALGVVGGVKLGKRFLGGPSGFLKTISTGGFNEGGVVPGVGKADSVRARLTPGEFVMNPEATEAIGVKTLNNINASARKNFATGGLVGGTLSNIGSNPLSVAGGALALQGVVSTLGDVNDTFKTITNSVAGAGIQFALLSAAIKDNIDANKRAKQIEESKNKEEKIATASSDIIDKRDADNNTRLRAVSTIQNEIQNEAKNKASIDNKRKKLEEDFINQQQENEKALTEQKFKTAKQEEAILQKEAATKEKINKAQERGLEKQRQLEEKYNQTRIEAAKKSRNIEQEVSDLGKKRGELDASRPSGLVLSSKDIKRNAKIDQEIADIATKQNNLLKQRDTIQSETLKTTQSIKAEQNAISLAVGEEVKQIAASNNLDKQKLDVTNQRKAQEKQLTLNKKQESQLQSEINAKYQEAENSVKRQVALANKAKTIEQKRVASNAQYNAQLDASNKSLLRQQEITKKAEKAAITSQRITQGFVVGSVIAGQAGGFLSNAGNESIAAGGTSRVQSAAGGALSGAAGGAAFGAILGPFGAGVGAVVGGLTGLTTSLINAKKQIEQVQLAKTVEGVKAALDSITRGSLTAQEGSFGISNRLREIRSRQLENAGDSEASRNIQSEINSILPKLTVFLSGLADSSTTFEEFNKRGADAIAFLARQQNIPLDELNKKYKEQIINQGKLRAATEEEIRQKERESQRLRELNVISVAVANSFKQLEKTQNSIAASFSFASGNVNTSGFTNPAAGFSQLSTIGDIAGFEQQAKGLGKVFGEAGERLANEIVESAKVSKRLPDILLKLREQDPLGQGGEFVKKLGEELSDAPAFIRDAIVQQAKLIVGNEGKDVTIINEVRKDVVSVSKQLVSTIEETLGKSLEEAGQELTQRKNAFVQGIAQIQQAIDQANGRRFRAVDIGQQLLQTRLQRPLNEGEANQEFTKKLDIIAGNGPKTVSAIEKALGGVKGRLEQARANFQNLQATTPEEVRTAQNELKALSLESVRLTNTLKFLADSTIKVTNAQNELAKAEQQQQVEQGFLETLVAGTPEQQNTLAKQLSALNILIALQKEGNLQNTPKNVLQAALPILKSAGGASFQGIKLDDLLKQVLKDLTPAGLEGFGQLSDAGKNAQQRLEDALQKQIDANNALAKIMSNTGTDIANKLEPLLTDFIKKMREAFLEAERRAAQNKVSQAASDLKVNEAQNADIQLASNVFGVSPKEVKQIQAAADELKRLDKVQKSLRGLQLFGNQDISNVEIGGQLSKFGKGLPLRAPGGKNEAAFLKEVEALRSRQSEIYEEVTFEIFRTLRESGFNEDQIKEFSDEFDKLAGPELKDAGGLTAKEAQGFFKTIISGIAKKGTKELEDEKKRLELSLGSNRLLDTQAERDDIIERMNFFIDFFGVALEDINLDLADSIDTVIKQNKDKLNQAKEEAKRIKQSVSQQGQQQQQQQDKPQFIQGQGGNLIVPEGAVHLGHGELVPASSFSNENLNNGINKLKQEQEEKKKVEQAAKEEQKAAQQAKQQIPEATNPFEKRRLEEERRVKTREAAIAARQTRGNPFGVPTKKEEDEKRRADAIAARQQAQSLREEQLAAARQEAQQRLGQNRANRPDAFDPTNLINNQEGLKKQAEQDRKNVLKDIRDKQKAAASSPEAKARRDFTQALIDNQDEYRKNAEEDRKKALDNVRKRQEQVARQNGPKFEGPPVAAEKPDNRGFLNVDNARELGEAFNDTVRGFLNEENARKLGEAFTGGTDKLQTLSENLLEFSKNMPEEFNFTGNVKLDVVLNGAEILTNLQPELANLVKTEISDALTKLTNNAKIGGVFEK